MYQIKKIMLTGSIFLILTSSLFSSSFLSKIDKTSGDIKLEYQSDILEDPDIASVSDCKQYIAMAEDEKLEIFSKDLASPIGTKTFDGDIISILFKNSQLLVLVDGSEGNTLYAFNPGNLEENYKHVFADDVEGICAEKSNDYAYVLTDEPELKKMDLKTGETIWTTTPPANVKGMVYLETYDELVLIDNSSEGILYFYKPGSTDYFKKINIGFGYKFVRFSPDAIFIVDTHISVYDYDGNFVCSITEDDLNNNEIEGVLVTETNKIIIDTMDPHSKDDTVYVYDYINRSCSFDWKHEFCDNINSLIESPDNENLYILTDDGPDTVDSQVMCFDLETGNKDWVTHCDEEHNIILPAADNVYIVDSTNITSSEQYIIDLWLNEGSGLTVATIGANLLITIILIAIN